MLLVIAIGSVLLVGCNASKEPAAQAATATAAPTLELKATTAQLMNWIFDTRAHVVWASTGSVITEKGEEQLAPKTEEAWADVRNAAATVAEAGNLLMVAPHARDQGDWVAMTRTMIDEANKCVAAAEAKDLEALFTAGGDLYLACTACHAKYLVGEPLKN
jgi:hypothetical protein